MIMDIGQSVITKYDSRQDTLKHIAKVTEYATRLFTDLNKRAALRKIAPHAKTVENCPSEHALGVMGMNILDILECCVRVNKIYGNTYYTQLLKEFGHIHENSMLFTICLNSRELFTKNTIHDNLVYMAFKLSNVVSVHDRSKLEDPEKAIFDAYTPILKGLTYGSDKYTSCLEQMGVAIKHHHMNNPSHHPEGHVDGMFNMNLLNLMEMICDWSAATTRHDDGDIIKSIDINEKRFGYDSIVSSVFSNTVYDFQMGAGVEETPDNQH